MLFLAVGRQNTTLLTNERCRLAQIGLGTPRDEGQRPWRK